ncbi:MAG: glycerol-3-phosphate dehydrogenase/oxidase [Deltaproteobacteria bacterium]|nr:glycerol-3-phosphate dehydrogenase/oxidase [Deltaproteobacteria bacterium]
MQNNTDLNFIDRQKCFKSLEEQEFDVLVIGAGITGCGIARDAAMRGLKTALVEAKDIASGTSSRSSKLIHGGLRYLLQGQLAIVRETANERRILRKIAPHLSLTNPMVILGKNKSAIKTYRTALWTYEKLGKVEKQEQHKVWQVPELQSREPAVNSVGLKGAVVYPEYLTDDSRLTLANARSAAAHGAVIVTRAEAREIILEKNRAAGAIVQGTLAGEERSAEVRARLVINAAGPWVDAIRRLEDGNSSDRLQLTKGIHLVIPHKRLPLNNTVVWNAPDKRPLFAVPRGQFAYIGTTDTFYPQPDYLQTITSDEVDYLLGSANSVFSGEPLAAKDVESVWSGLRPLLSTKGKKPSEVSRRDEVMIGPCGTLSIAGGKLTSFRTMATRMVDLCEQLLGRKKPRSAGTENEPLPGGTLNLSVEAVKSKVNAMGISVEESARVAMLYVDEALNIFSNGCGPAVEAAYAVNHEGALMLEDYWERRSSRATFDVGGGMASLEPAATAMSELLGWSDRERERQIELCRTQRQKTMQLL